MMNLTSTDLVNKYRNETDLVGGNPYLSGGFGGFSLKLFLCKKEKYRPNHYLLLKDINR
jgi:hypothetical protein